MGDPLVLTKVLDLPIGRERLWAVLSDTDRLNRSIGLSPVTYDARPTPAGGIERFAAMPMAALNLRWREMPFEWVRPEEFRVQRLFDSGPLREMTLGCTLASEGTGTRLTIRGEFRPRHLPGRWLAEIVGRKAVHDMERVAQHAVATSRDEVATYPHHARRGAVRADILASRVAAWKNAEADELAPLLAHHLENAPDEDVIRMRPFAFADQWSRPRLDVLRSFLAATRAGLLELFWVPICPHCRGGRDGHRGLAAVAESAFCESCHTDFGVDFDERLEVRFTVHPEIRAVTDAVYCIGGPGNTPHILAQQRLGPAEERAVTLNLEAASYRVSCRAAAPDRILRPRIPSVSRNVDGAGQEPITVRFASDQSTGAGEESEFEPGAVTFILRNATADEQVVAVVAESWDARAATAAMVTSLAEYRDQFAADVLSPGCELAVRSLAVLFSDIRASTELYDRIGDAPAYAGVREHFAFLGERIRDRRGTIVKTMGDAVMAVFASGADALAACLAIQRDVGIFNERESGRLGDRAIVLKLGVHRGPLIAVNSNDRLDYFGRTVNVAARAQQLADGGDVVATSELFDEYDGAGLADEFGAAVETFVAEVKGVARPIEMRRLRVPAAAPTAAPGAR